MICSRFERGVLGHSKTHPGEKSHEGKVSDAQYQNQIPNTQCPMPYFTAYATTDQTWSWWDIPWQYAGYSPHSGQCTWQQFGTWSPQMTLKKLSLLAKHERSYFCHRTCNLTQPQSQTKIVFDWYMMSIPDQLDSRTNLRAPSLLRKAKVPLTTLSTPSSKLPTNLKPACICNIDSVSKWKRKWKQWKWKQWKWKQ